MISYDIFLWLTLFSMIISKSIHVAANGINPFFLWLRNIPVVSIYHLFYPFLCQWTFRLLPRLGYCKQCCSEHWGACIFLECFLWIYAQEWDCKTPQQLHFQVFKELPYYSPWWLYQFTFSPTVQQHSFFSPHHLQHYCRLFGDGHSEQCEVILWHNFDLCFSNYQQQ